MGGCGPTRLHKDVADAVNLMAYACKDREAIWHVFRQQDFEGITDWMKIQFKCQGHPIHWQKYYLTDEDLDDLSLTKGIRPYVIKQWSGSMVFIPAGCAHEVCHILLFHG
jgi:lysine-specific demethylase 3